MPVHHSGELRPHVGYERAHAHNTCSWSASATTQSPPRPMPNLLGHTAVSFGLRVPDTAAPRQYIQSDVQQDRWRPCPSNRPETRKEKAEPYSEDKRVEDLLNRLREEECTERLSHLQWIVGHVLDIHKGVSCARQLYKCLVVFLADRCALWAGACMLCHADFPCMLCFVALQLCLFVMLNVMSCTPLSRREHRLVIFCVVCTENASYFSFMHLYLHPPVQLLTHAC